MAEVTAVLRSNYDAVRDGRYNLDSVQYGQVKGWRPMSSMPYWMGEPEQHGSAANHHSSSNEDCPRCLKDGVDPLNFILVTTKNIPDVPPSVADFIAPAVTPGRTVIVLSQNGINIEKPLILQYPTTPLVSSVAYIGATETSLGNILFDDRDVQKIGAFESPAVPAIVASDAAMRYVNIYNPQGELEVSYEPDVAQARWRKLAYNASFNPIAAILRMDTSRIKLSGHLIEDLILPIVHEIQAAAKAKNIEMQHDLADQVVSQDPIDSPFKPSMLQDIEKNNLMEIENILGEPLREGEARGVPMPTLRLAYGLMKG